jgi:hypothetical protein
MDNFRKNREEKREKIRTQSIFNNAVNTQQNLMIKMARLPDEAKKAILNNVKT